MDERRNLTTEDIAGRTHGEGEDDEYVEIGQEEGESTAPRMETSREQDETPLLPSDESRRFRDRWQEIQTGFVDRPQEAVQEADRLVADLMQRLAAEFSDTRSTLEQQWDGEDDVSTEDLRVALTRYRAFFERLLSA